MIYSAGHTLEAFLQFEFREAICRWNEILQYPVDDVSFTRSETSEEK
jgi:hypothetical protein